MQFRIQLLSPGRTPAFDNYRAKNCVLGQVVFEGVFPGERSREYEDRRAISAA